MNALECIKNGITQNSMELVAKGYFLLTGTKVSVKSTGNDSVQRAQKILDFIQSVLDDQEVANEIEEEADEDIIIEKKKTGPHKGKKRKSKAIDENRLKSIIDNENEDELEKRTNFKSSRVNLDAGPVSMKGIQPVCPANNSAFIDEELQAINSKLSDKLTQRRQPYTPRLGKCDSCQKEFDLNKVYAKGILQDQSILCSKCLTRGKKGASKVDDEETD